MAVGISSSFDAAIVGGGACGLSVLIQLVEKGSEGLQVAIFEKRDTVGPGLAYTKACAGARINTPAGDMGLSASNPGDFVRWMRENPSEDSGGDMYPFRNYYGRYIQSEMDRIVKLAKTKGVELTVYQTEVTDIEQQQHKKTGWIIHTKDDKSYQATKTVLTMGNHIRQLNKHLDGKPLYFDSPWPSSRLLDIPKANSVAILGSRLTAIDEAIYLAKRGHTGPIYLCSRTGQLPKVQGGSKKGDCKKYERTYTLYNLAREVEKSSEHTLLKVACHIYEEVKSISTSDSMSHEQDETSQEKDGNDRVAEFRRDVELAQRDDNPAFRVLTETGPTSERYWNCLSNTNKRIFLDEYLSTWISYRAAMPLWTGEKLLQLLESGQVRILRTDSATSISHSSSGFRIPTISSSSSSSSEEIIHVDSLVEATGLEFDITKIETCLMRNLLSRDLISPHRAGGVDVDFRTLRAKKGLYFLGSLNRGVHFHTTTLDRSVVHAEWVADDVLGFQPRRFLHIALFIGHDLVSQSVVERLVPLLLGMGHMPFIYFSTSSKSISSIERKDTASVHDDLRPSDTGSCLNIQLLRQKYGVLVQDVSDTQDPAEIIRSLKCNHIDFGYSIQWPSQVDAKIIKFFQSPRQGLFTLLPNSSTSRLPSLPEFRYGLQEISQSHQGTITFTRVQIHERYPIKHSGTASNNEQDGPSQYMIKTMLQHMEQIARGDPQSTSQHPHQNERNAIADRYGLKLQGAHTIKAG